MKKILVFLALSFLFAAWSGAALSQELVVFTNDTAMSVKSHSEKNGYIFLYLQEGQIAVPRERVKEIIKSKASRSGGSEGSAPSQASPGPAVQEPVKTGDGRPPGLRAPDSEDDDDEDYEDDDEDDDDSDDDEDDEEDNKDAITRGKGLLQPRNVRPSAPQRSARPTQNPLTGGRH